MDELERLRASCALRQLLTHYASGENAEVWQDRRMQLEGVTARELAQLHGELMAYGWIEQNIGPAPVMRQEAVARCYRATAAGRRALRWVSRPGADADAPSTARAA
jgi:hypothetical protein